MTRKLSTLGLALILSWSSFAATPKAVAGKPPLILSFDGKGVAMAWDIGVMQSFHKHLQRDRVSDLYFVGTSSGSVLATFFACNGLNDTAMANVVQAAHIFPKDVIDEAQNKKSVQLFLGVPPETTLDAVNPILDFVTNNSTCLPTLPLLIAAANLDVIDGRIAGKPFAGRRGRTVDTGTFVLSEDGKPKGKACTYFVNDAMAELLKDVPAQERLCDLRHLRTAADVRMAIVASISEPTYYPTVPETDRSQVESVFPVPTNRAYQGGFVLISPIQDLKRAHPETWVYSTGHPVYNRLENRMIQNWFAVPLNETLLQQLWWFDAQVPMTLDNWKWLHDKKTTPPEQLARGFEVTETCFAKGSKGCVPSVNLTPHFANDLHGGDLKAKRARGIDALTKK